jgi:hypothetical protein
MAASFSAGRATRFTAHRSALSRVPLASELRMIASFALRPSIVRTNALRG